MIGAKMDISLRVFILVGHYVLYPIQPAARRLNGAENTRKNITEITKNIVTKPVLGDKTADGFTI